MAGMNERKRPKKRASSEERESPPPNKMENQRPEHFTIPKVSRLAPQSYLELCYTNRREYDEIHSALSESRLDLSSDLLSSWQFGDVKLVHNDDLQKRFSTKRAEMREAGRHATELQEHFCFQVLPDSAILEIICSGVSTRESPMKALGNPRRGVYVYRNVDVALQNCQRRRADNVLICKILLGRKNSVLPVVDSKKLFMMDPTPNFDCHVSRNAPSLKEALEQQAIASSVYFYEFDQYSKPVRRPRQCLPYAVVTARFKGTQREPVQHATSLKFQSKFSTGCRDFQK